MVKITFFQAGYCTFPEAIVSPGSSWKTAIFPSLFALITHPREGLILFDTGYSDRFYPETRKFPLRFYALTTPAYIKPEESAANQLQQHNIDPATIKYIIISHFHADHLGGLLDFPNAQFICTQTGYESVKNKRGLAALKAGFIPNFIPVDFSDRAIFIETKQPIELPSQYHPFTTGFDIFKDQNLLITELPGHAKGQIGLFLTDANNQNYFLIADACWLSRAYQELITPNPITNLIFANKKEYIDTLKNIHQLHQNNPNLKIIPTHCLHTWKQLELQQTL